MMVWWIAVENVDNAVDKWTSGGGTSIDLMLGVILLRGWELCSYLSGCAWPLLCQPDNGSKTPI